MKPPGGMRPRDPDEAHRVSTPLELLFDLCFVVAVAQASSHLHHGLSEARWGRAILGYALVFFAIWWAWMNFTWFASAYDADDVPYRLAVLVQIAGVLVLAAGVPRAFEQRDFHVATAGYAIMRVGLVALWLRAAASDRAGRRTAVRYAIGLTLVQLGWLGPARGPHRRLAGGLARAGPRGAAGAGLGRVAPADQLAPPSHRGAVRAAHPHRARRVGALGVDGDPGRGRRGHGHSRPARGDRRRDPGPVRDVVALLRRAGPSRPGEQPRRLRVGLRPPGDLRLHRRGGGRARRRGRLRDGPRPSLERGGGRGGDGPARPLRGERVGPRDPPGAPASTP